jgi:hypothetical protein
MGLAVGQLPDDGAIGNFCEIQVRPAEPAGSIPAGGTHVFAGQSRFSRISQQTRALAVARCVLFGVAG